MVAPLSFMRCLFPNATSAGQENLMTPSPKEVFSAPANSAVIGIDFGGTFSVDQFYLGTIIGSVTGVNVYSGTSLGAQTTLLGAANLAPSTVRRRTAFLRLGAPVSLRYLTFGIAGSATDWTIGIATAGLSIQPAWGHEWGSGRGIIDRSAKNPLLDGGWGRELGAKVPFWQFTCGDLDDTEVANLWDMIQDVGESSPVLVAEDPSLVGSALANSLHYGLFDRPEAYERQAPALNRWSFRVVEWV